MYIPLCSGKHPLQLFPESGTDHVVGDLQDFFDGIEHVAFAGPVFIQDFGVGIVDDAVEDVSGDGDIVNIADGADKTFGHQIDGGDEVGNGNPKLGFVIHRDVRVNGELAHQVEQVGGEHQEFGILVFPARIGLLPVLELVSEGLVKVAILIRHALVYLFSSISVGLEIVLSQNHLV